jgi:thioredoxin reductase (NADPH)
MYDVIVLGKGPAGIQAAVYVKRANLNVLVIGKDGGALGWTEHVGNFYGFDHITGPELLEKGIQQAQTLGIEVKSCEVTSVSYLGHYLVKTTEAEFEAKAVILASGAPRTRVKIDNLKNLEGKGVSYCAICDAFFYRQKEVAVIGHGEYAAQEAHELINIVGSVTVFTNGEEPTGHFDERVKIITEPIQAILGEDRVSGVQLKNGDSFPVHGVFVALGSASATDLALKIGALVENNKIVVDDKKMTNVPGLFAAGDCTPGIMQIAKAVGDGCIAGIEAIGYVRRLK